jgi:hypothetical protein
VTPFPKHIYRGSSLENVTGFSEAYTKQQQSPANILLRNRIQGKIQRRTSALMENSKQDIGENYVRRNVTICVLYQTLLR